jgi:peptidoglycan/xylan/chitin deacetylase (PgdA/CDA1 family)
LEDEFQKTEDAIEAVTGKRTVGFRGPGFSLSDQVLKTMIRRGYEYDCSTFPTYLGPIARAY